ncbi:MAG: sel1 repeat family protein [Neisseriaceae bacterium]|nr:sel1 repeat family protein [Neisseriaceae bacterium]
MNLKSLLLTTCLALATTPLFTACQVSHKTKSELGDLDLSKAKEAYNNGNYAEAAQLFEQAEQLYQKTIQLHEKACAENNPTSCRAVGQFYEQGEIIVQDKEKSKAFYAKSKAFYTKTSELWEKSCHKQDAEACMNIGSLYYRAYARSGLQEYQAKATEFWKKACDGGQKQACELLQKPTQNKTQETTMPQMPKLPSLDLLQQEINSNQQYIKSQIVQKDGKTKYFFKQDKSLVKQKVAGGYYRIVLGKTAAGDCAVQDFYADTDQKRSEPLIVAKKDCNNFNTWGYDGAWILYDEKQQLKLISHFKDGEMLDTFYRDDDGIAYVNLADKHKDTFMFKTDNGATVLVYHDGKIAEVSRFYNEDDVVTVRYVNGKADIATAHLWIDGKENAIEPDAFDEFTKEMDTWLLEMGTMFGALIKGELF